MEASGNVDFNGSANEDVLGESLVSRVKCLLSETVKKAEKAGNDRDEQEQLRLEAQAVNEHAAQQSEEAARQCEAAAVVEASGPIKQDSAVSQASEVTIHSSATTSASHMWPLTAALGISHGDPAHDDKETRTTRSC